MNEKPPSRPLLIWDGDCSFCRRWITRWKHVTREAIEYQPSQIAGDRYPQIPKQEFDKSVFLVEPDGKVTRAAEAVFRSLALGGRYRFLLSLYQHAPPFAWITETAYRFIARHRDPIDRVDKIIIGTETRPATYVLTRGLFLRSIGAVYLIAFISLFVQIDGLIGSNGILPAANFAAAAKAQLGSSRWWLYPTLVHFSASDRMLHGLCITGIAAGIVLIIGAMPVLATIVLWICYLSLFVAGQVFLGYQWDVLLLEAGFLAILFSPPLWAGSLRRPSRVVLFLIRWLLLRLMVLSALVKWFSGDSSWRDMTALRFHFETQPIPTWTAWHMQNSPRWELSFSCAVMFFIEAIVPLLYFAPRRTRMLGFWLTVLLQVMIMATGNYGFFNVLTIVLAFSLLDDSAVERLFNFALPLKWQRRFDPLTIVRKRPIVRPIVVWPLAILIFALGITRGIDRVNYEIARVEAERTHDFDRFRNRMIKWPLKWEVVEQYTSPFVLANSYGLFAVMTKERPELIVEGSDDFSNWTEYAFKWKSGDVIRAPAFCEPHMPRLDWQMWFAALDPNEVQPWVESLTFKLLTGQPEVLKLMGPSPFPDRPPKYIRIALYDYHFSTPTERAAKGAWWTRKRLREYMPAVDLNPQTQQLELSVPPASAHS